MTNLLDARRYPAEQFGALYHRRWRVEEAFKRIKHRLRLEAPSGLNYLAFQQDFAAKVLADNLSQLLSAETETPDARRRVPPQSNLRPGQCSQLKPPCMPNVGAALRVMVWGNFARVERGSDCMRWRRARSATGFGRVRAPGDSRRGSA